jgi:hypothetical protein
MGCLRCLCENERWDWSAPAGRSPHRKATKPSGTAGYLLEVERFAPRWSPLLSCPYKSTAEELLCWPENQKTSRRFTIKKKTRTAR